MSSRHLLYQTLAALTWTMHRWCKPVSMRSSCSGPCICLSGMAVWGAAASFIATSVPLYLALNTCSRVYSLVQGICHVSTTCIDRQGGLQACNCKPQGFLMTRPSGLHCVRCAAGAYLTLPTAPKLIRCASCSQAEFHQLLWDMQARLLGHKGAVLIWAAWPCPALRQAVVAGRLWQQIGFRLLLLPTNLAGEKNTPGACTRLTTALVLLEFVRVCDLCREV